MKKYLAILFLFLAGCAAGPDVRTLDGEICAGGMNGAENLCFDGQGVMYVSSLDGRVFKIEPGCDIAQMQLGEMCLGMEFFDNHLYVGAHQEDDPSMQARIYRLSPDLEDAFEILGPVPGLNGFALADGWLYYTSSKGWINRRGTIYRICLTDGKNACPEVFLSDIGWVNGLAFNQDNSLLYYTEMFGGVWKYDIKNNEKKQIYDPGCLKITDDLTVAQDSTLYVCSNSHACILHLSPEGRLLDAWRPDILGTPSACRLGDKGFDPNTLYITEFSSSRHSLRQNGRGVAACAPESDAGVRCRTGNGGAPPLGEDSPASSE